MTWALFGEARKKDESVINLQSTSAEVAFTFDYEGDTFRVLRSATRGKTGTLEFQVLDEGTAVNGSTIPLQGNWRPLTEHRMSETQQRIEQVLRLDYETFVNVSFFLQGRADEFAQQKPSQRKKILGNILGLEIWEIYKERAAERRRDIASRIKGIDGNLEEIDKELEEEPARKEKLAGLEKELAQQADMRKTQESTLASLRNAHAIYEKQAEIFKKNSAALKEKQAELDELTSQLAQKQADCNSSAELLARAAEVDAAYAAWGQARQELERWNKLGQEFHAQEKLRQPFLDEINTEKVKLEQELARLKGLANSARSQQEEISHLSAGIEETRGLLETAEAKNQEREAGKVRCQEARVRQEGLRTEQASLKMEMDRFEARKIQLTTAEGATCPLCGQPLSAEHRQVTLEQIQAEGTQRGDAFRANKALLDELAVMIEQGDKRIRELASAEKEQLTHSNSLARLTERLETAQKGVAEWEKTGAGRLLDVEGLLTTENFARTAREQLAQVDRELAALGYAAEAHETVRQVEQAGRSSEEEYRRLGEARAAIKPLKEAIDDIGKRIAKLQSGISSMRQDLEEETASLKSLDASASDLRDAERRLFDLRELEGKLNQDVGSARTNVKVLDTQRARKKLLGGEREELAQQDNRYKKLERAFGKDGVPALLIEQALPEIESKANELLDRLSDGTMAVRFVTQSEYKAKKREDLKETLDIQISDGAGVRDYEMYSGGEAFLVNFAIRLALSEVLASRKGARLQMLVIDEGFGSQDELGRQRLIQSINAVQNDFAKILVITHLEEMKDAFPTRIVVEKTVQGSTIQVN